ncbi:MAG: type II toxin-antitoxin system VapC family toxin [Solirubrobacterales bacterium]
MVVDTSVVLDALVGSDPASRSLRKRLRGAKELHAPHLIDVELLHVLRRLSTAGEISVDRAQDAIGDLADLRLQRYPHHPMADRIWELRSHLTAYDAAFVALAELLGMTLLTRDGPLAAAPGVRCEVELIDSDSAHPARP